MPQIELNDGHIMQFDECDRHLVELGNWRFYLDRTGHGRVTRWCPDTSTRLVFHRLVLNAPRGEEVDHKNRNTLDNRRENLRLCSHRQNTCNRKHKKASGLPKGVYRHTGKTYRAAIMVDGTWTGLGRFTCPIKAAVAYDRAAERLHGDFAALNFPPDRDWILPEPTPTKRAATYARQANGRPRRQPPREA